MRLAESQEEEEHRQLQSVLHFMQTQKSFYKNLLNYAYPESRVQLALNKKQIFLVTRPPTC